MKFAAFSFIAVSGALATTTTTTAPTNIPSPGGACVGDAYCLGSTSPIILRCVDGIAQAGNCDDNLDEPQYGAVCVSNAPEQAYCTAVNPFANSTTTSTTATYYAASPISTPIATNGTGNGTLSYIPTAPPATSSTGSTGSTASSTPTGSTPISTGGAAGHWTGGAMLGAAVAMLGSMIVL